MRKGSIIGVLLFTALIGGYFIALNSQIHRVNQFCAAMKPAWTFIGVRISQRNMMSASQTCETGTVLN